MGIKFKEGTSQKATLKAPITYVRKFVTKSTSTKQTKVPVTHLQK